MYVFKNNNINPLLISLLSIDQLVIHPQTFSLGIETLTVDFSGFAEETEPIADPFWFTPLVQQHRAARSKGEPWEYLTHSRSTGPLLYVKRGKQLLLAAGQVSNL